MKKVIFIAIMLMFVTLSTTAQEVKFHFNSKFKFVTDDEKEFVVIPMDGYSQDSLFRAVSLYWIENILLRQMRLQNLETSK